MDKGCSSYRFGYTRQWIIVEVFAFYMNVIVLIIMLGSYFILPTNKLQRDKMRDEEDRVIQFLAEKEIKNIRIINEINNQEVE